MARLHLGAMRSERRRHDARDAEHMKTPSHSMGGSQPRFDLALLTGSHAAGSAGQAEWRRVFNHFNPRLNSYFARRVEDRDALDDLISEIWRRVMLNVHLLKSQNALWSWMLQIGVNLLRDLGRQGVRQNGRRISLDHLAPAELEQLIVPRLLDEPGSIVDGDSLREALGELAPMDRELLELHVIDELTHAEIASRLNLDSEAASRKRLQRLRSQLKGRLTGSTGYGHPRAGRAEENER